MAINRSIVKYFITVLLTALLTSCFSSQLITGFDETLTDIQFNSSFTLTLPRPLAELAITDPDSIWFYLQGNDLNKTLYPQGEFVQLKKIEINTGKLKATQWIDGKANYANVFTKAGVYTIYLSDNLETEPDNAITFIRKVRLVDPAH